ncbi:phage tail protein [Morganella morganii]|uniref:phage tail protein n=1 Tax=Morganella morganii TaxID=582 RepID=UPI0032D9BAD3
MTAKYFAILTNYGAAQLANAVALGTQMNITAMGAGDGGGTLPVPDPAQTTLIRENRRAAVNQVSVDEKNPNIIIAEQVIPENEGGWWIREIGLYDDNGGLIAVGNVPETYKPNLQEGSGRTQVLQMALIVSSTQAVTLKVDPSVVLATREYVTKSIDAAIQASEARAAQTYQQKGDYVTNPYLKLELLKKIDKADITQQLGNDTGKVVSQNLLTTELGKKASVADVNGKLAKDQNGADIPDKPKFIENTGLRELLDKKFDKAGGKIAGQTDIEAPGGRAQTLKAMAGTSIYQEFYLLAVLAAWVGITNGDTLTLANSIAGKRLTISPDGFKIDGRDIATTPQLFGVGQTYKDVTASRKNGVTYTNNSTKPIVVCVECNRTAATSDDPYSFGAVVDGHRVDYRWTTINEISMVSFIVPAGSSYYVQGGWGQTHPWEPLVKWVELS